MKLLTAAASWGTVVALVQITPKALHLPGLERVNAQLAHEIAERKRSEELLRQEEERAVRVVALVVRRLRPVPEQPRVEVDRVVEVGDVQVDGADVAHGGGSLRGVRPAAPKRPPSSSRAPSSSSDDRSASA